MSELEMLYEWLGKHPDNAVIFKSYNGNFVAQTIAEGGGLVESEGLTIADAIRLHEDEHGKRVGQ